MMMTGIAANNFICMLNDLTCKPKRSLICLMMTSLKRFLIILDNKKSAICRSKVLYLVRSRGESYLGLKHLNYEELEIVEMLTKKENKKLTAQCVNQTPESPLSIRMSGRNWKRECPSERISISIIVK
jgi:hypothetical protein